MIELFLSLFPATAMPAIASDPFIMVTDAIAIILLTYIIINRGLNFVVGWVGAAYAITLFGFIGSFLWVYDRLFYHQVPTPQFALWALKDIGVVMGLFTAVIRDWRRRP